MYGSKPTKRERGQGLVEYALILVLVAIVVIGVTAVLGQAIHAQFCGIMTGIGGELPDGLCDTDVLTISKSDYSGGEVHIHAESNGGSDSGTTLSAAPGGTMENHSGHGHYHIKFSATCPCTITITSSEGGSKTITINP